MACGCPGSPPNGEESRINAYILRWARKKYKRLRAFKRAMVWWNGVVKRDPTFLSHWQWTTIAWMAG